MSTLRLPLLAALVLSGCRPASMAAAHHGERLFHDARLSSCSFNSYSCDTCHTTSPEPEAGRLPVGGTLHGVAFRDGFFGGAETDLLEAVNVCFTRFMRSPDPLSRDGVQSRALYEYLVRLSPSREPAPARPFTVVRQVADMPRGDRARGEEVWRATCQVCHGDAQTGQGRIGEDAVVVSETVQTYPTTFPGVAPALVVVEKVRHGRFFGIGGTMPPYSREALSDEDLGALLTFLGL